MRMLQLHAGYRTPAGEDTVVNAEAAALRRAGHTVHQHIEQNPTSSVKAIGALARSRNNKQARQAVAEVIDEFDPDVVHVHNTWFALSSSVFDAAAEANRPVVMTIHNYRLGCLSVDLFRGSSVCTACVGRSPLRGVVHGCYRGSRAQSAIAAVEVMSTRRRGALDAVDRFVAPSAFMADRLVEIGVPADRLVVKPHFTADVGARPNPPSASNEILFIGRLAAGKGLEVLLRAWERRDRAAHPDARLCIIGDGPLASELHEAAPRDVEFAGWLPYDDVQRRMLSARALVFPSEWYEPFGMVLIESMSAGLPVLASSASDAARITAAPPECVSPAGDERALADVFAALTDDAVDAAGRAARARFESTYSEAVGVEALEALYDSVIGAARS
ncbi:glycosyltransferase [Ilumatobacter coccineus]|uniref:Glycosyltransferase n=1 Tax=Ilumatobacter coccineus (strain NBRC 103263 / KCTC 29153 / YM16-304) TaxID=1313172 RepID=A0A6C7E6Z0_ILUCY|nr:glycosyltransferase [Ilumatobacter coccineus]BAN02527.1 glycosyltransferase [Ilumatobacter coccineus YM16-304]